MKTIFYAKTKQDIASKKANTDLIGFPAEAHNSSELKELILAASAAGFDCLISSDSNDFESIVSLVETFHPDWIQINGNISLKQTRKINKLYPQVKLLKRINVQDIASRSQAYQFSDCVEALLLKKEQINQQSSEEAVEKSQEIIKIAERCGLLVFVAQS